MKPKYRVRLETLALETLEESVSYIRAESGAGRAKSWLRSMLRAIDDLESLPKAHGVCSHRGGQAIYSKLVQTHRVFYVVHDASNTVRILDIVHTARDSRLSEYREEDDA